MSSTSFDMTTAKRCAYLSGVLSLVSTAILISDIAGFRSSNDMPDCPMNGDGPRRGGGFALNNTACQRERLAMAHSMRGYTIGFELTDALASFFIIPAVLTLGEVLGKGSSTRHLLVPPLVIVPIIRFFELSTMAGTEQVVTWMGTSEYFNLDGPGIEALIISAWVTRSAFMWLSSTDSLLMGVGLVTAGRMALREGKFHRCWAIISVLTGILGFLVFLLDMFRFTDYFFISFFGMMIHLLIAFILYPIIVVWLGSQLHQYETERTFLATGAGDDAL